MTGRLTAVVLFAVLLLRPLSGAGVAVGAAVSSAVRYPSVPFVLTCSVVEERRDDPIMAPAKAGMSHLHTFFGAAVVGATMTSTAMQRARTSCTPGGDHSAYWMPSRVGVRLRVYYDAGMVDPPVIVAYRAGQQLLAGDRSATGPVGVEVLAFRCGRIGDGPDGEGWVATAPVGCGGSSRRMARLTFPQCWDGASAAFSSVVAAHGSRCPLDHPVALPRLRMLVEVPSNSVSSGPLSGFHGDVISSWSPAVLDDLVRVCIRGERRTNVELKRCGLLGGL